MAKTENKDQKTIKEIAQKLLELMDLKNIKIKISVDKEKVVNLNIDCDEPGILIGHHGETISGLQLIISLLAYKELLSWQRIILDVGDWREKRAEVLKNMALNAAQRVKFSGEEAVLPYLNAGERRIVHIYLADNSDVTSESIGEGEERRLVIKPKDK